ncbi:MAG: ribosomal protein L11 methyltransferase [Arenicella sp.]|jgi:ribosomal protein L11 methyltransferase
MSFIVIKVECPEDFSDILKVELSELGFDTFMDLDDTNFEGSVPAEEYQEQETELLITDYQTRAEIKYSLETVAKQNWNKLWEENFHPIAINDDCYIRAHFHEPAKGYKYELVITPKMSFGTGHHATTSTMIQQQLLVDHKGKSVFDIGTGTGVLAIMAHKLGASQIDACDIEDWSVENVLENAEANKTPLNKVYCGTAEEVKGDDLYDILLANINLNVHKSSFQEYARLIKPNGTLLMSGFYEQDIPTILELGKRHGFKEKTRQIMNNWTCLVLEKVG